jgi:mycothiol S-conjugate amidase
MEAAGLESHYSDWLKRWEDKPEDIGKITTRVRCDDFFEVRDRALIAHATQIDPDSWWFRCPLEIQRQAWPTEDYQLARNLTDSQTPEDDLFSGIHEGAVVGE